MVRKSNFPVGWEVNAIVNLFVYDFLRDEYFSTQDASVRRFHELQTEWGIPAAIDLASFIDPSNGYLRDDSCTFGAEIFIVRPNTKGFCVSMVQEPPSLFYRWKFHNFSKAHRETYESEPFLAGDYKWNLLFYPKGCQEGEGNSISLFLTIDISSIPPNTKLYVHCILRAKDQVSDQHVEFQFYSHYSKLNPSWGSTSFVRLAKLRDPTKCLSKGDSCIFEAEFKVLGLIHSTT